MSTSQEKQDPKAPAVEEAAQSKKQKYDAPDIVWEEDFEPAAQATGCGHIIGDCPAKPVS